MTNLEHLIYVENSTNWLSGVLCSWYSGECCRGCPMAGKQFDNCHYALAKWLSAKHIENDENNE